MAPTADEELKLRLYTGELSQLGSAERFLKVLVDIPFAYKRLESLLFMCTLQEDVAATKESLGTLEVGLCLVASHLIFYLVCCWFSISILILIFYCFKGVRSCFDSVLELAE